jgi:hypothetical protein
VQTCKSIYLATSEPTPSRKVITTCHVTRIAAVLSSLLSHVGVRVSVAPYVCSPFVERLPLKVPPMRDIPEHQAAFGLAALSICESLLLALRDLRIIGELEIVGILKDASAAHHNAVVAAKDPKAHDAPPPSLIASSRDSLRHS